VGIHDLFERACQAYARRCKKEGFIYERPTHSRSGVDLRSGMVRLASVRGVLATYRWNGKRLVFVPPQEPEPSGLAVDLLPAGALLTVEPRYVAGRMTMK
jgi:hypothetical protein